MSRLSEYPRMFLVISPSLRNALRQRKFKSAEWQFDHRNARQIIVLKLKRIDRATPDDASIENSTLLLFVIDDVADLVVRDLVAFVASVALTALDIDIDK